MTGYRSSEFRHKCGNAENCYIERLPEWDDIIHVFPRKIRPTDIDGMVEINDHFLFLEEKAPGVAMLNGGQSYALKALASRDRVTVCFFRPLNEHDVTMLAFGHGRPGVIEDRTRDEFLDWLRSWVAEAEGATP